MLFKKRDHCSENTDTCSFKILLLRTSYTVPKPLVSSKWQNRGPNDQMNSEGKQNEVTEINGLNASQVTTLP